MNEILSKCMVLRAKGVGRSSDVMKKDKREARTTNNMSMEDGVIKKVRAVKMSTEGRLNDGTIKRTVASALIAKKIGESPAIRKRHGMI